LSAWPRKPGYHFLFQCGDSERLKPYFSEMADKVINSKPVVLTEVDFGRRLKRKLTKGIAKRL
jgi:hypothetical protein